MEADFNFLNKLAGKRIMHNAEQANSIADEQFGSRKAKGAINHAINKQLTLDIMRQEKRKFTLVILDAKGCYDRIAPSIASISLKRQGTPASYVMMLFSTIRDMKHFIRTAYGDSREFYHEQDVPFHGILQGNGAGPTIWAMVSSPLLDRMREKGHGIQIMSDGGFITIPAFAFVDDTDLAQDNENDDGIESTQRAVSEWEDALRATGGLLVPHKCKFFVVEHTWTNKDNWKIVDEIHNEVELRIQDDDGNSHPIQQLPATASELALGIMFSPSGNMDGEVKYLKEKAMIWAEKVRVGQLTHREAWYCLNATVLRAIEYALAATTLSLKQLNLVMQPILNIGLPRSGICRKTSRCLIFAPIRFQGFGIRHPFIGQGIAKIRSLFDTRQSLTQRLIEVTWSHTAVEAGLGDSFLDHDIKWFYDLISDGWMKSLWEFLSTYNISLIRMSSIIKCQFRHHKDVFIMAAVADKGNAITKQDRITFNLCRIYLQVTLLSDISTADGGSIQTHFWKGIQQRKGKGWWPKQPRPSERAWKVWRRILKTTFNTNDMGKYLLRLPHSNPTEDWRFFLQLNTDSLYEKLEDGRWQEYTTLVGRRHVHSRRYINPRICDSPMGGPIQAVSTYASGNGFSVDGKGTSQFVRTTEAPVWYDFTKIHYVGNREHLHWAITNNQQLILVSDGSSKDHTAAAAWILTTESLYMDGIYVVGRAKVPGSKPDSHRAECFGIFGGMTLLLSVLTACHASDASNVSVCFACDNKSALHYAFASAHSYIGADTPDFDILQAIRILLLESGIQPTWRHVKGHQSGLDLDIWAKLNNLADDWAGQARVDPSICFPPPRVYLGNENWHLILGSDEKVCKKMSKYLVEHCSTPQVRDVLGRYNRVQDGGFDKVDWDALERAMQESTIRQRHWISKRAARDCGCNYIRFKRRERWDDSCPFCGECETVLHVLKCPSTETSQLWESTIRDLQLWLADNGTDPSITDSLITGLQAWRRDPDGTPTLDAANTLLGAQSQIGWNGVLEGVLGREWTNQQSTYFKDQNSRRSGHRWMSILIRRLWKIPWELWQHRNHKEHLQDHEKMVTQLMQDVQEQITQGHNEIEELVRLFNPDEIDKISSNSRDVPYIRGWLRNVRAARHRDNLRRGTRGEMDQMRAVMRVFLNH
jgi:hypothetical protein